KAPTDYGYWNSYFRSLWPTMMFAWLAVGVAAVRSVPSRWFDSARIPTASLMTGVGAVAVVAGLAVPHVDPGTTNGSTDDSVTMAQPMIDRSVTLLKHRGQVEVSAGGDFSSLALTSTLVLALESYGVDVCVPADVVAQYGKHRACTKHGPNVYAMVSSAAFPPFPGQHVEWETTLLTRSEQRQRDRDAAKVRAWLATQHEVRVSPRVHHTLVEAYGFAGATGYERSQLDTHGAPPEALVFSPDFVTFIVTRSFWRPDGTADVAIDTGSLDPAVLLRWAELVYREYMGGSARVVSMKAAPGAAGTTGHHAK
ncbi:MAG: hypothetical protein JST73_08710, partial [Actinobacteria bacterium]|nr:hypothetical protein [Actinomycetota bacterium]